LAVDHLVVATSDLPADDPIVELMNEFDVPTVRGPEADVLARFGRVLDSIACDVVVRLTADCPLADPAVIEAAVEQHRSLDADYTSNTLARTYPDGLDVEVIRATALTQAVTEARDSEEREHVTPYLYRRPGAFRLGALCSGDDLGAERWTVDTPDDLEHLRSIVARLDDPLRAPWHEILAAAGRQATPRPGALWLRPECWPGVDHRRAWHAMIDDQVVGDAAVEIVAPGSGQLTYRGEPQHRNAAIALVRDALRADRQIARVQES
jgi:spore coat polysaccharide biosynthesis protein SpsF (cytidylyltransferase family)